MSATKVRRHEVIYVLERETNDKSRREPIGVYSTYLEALEVGKTVKGSYHHKISRVSMPNKGATE